MNLEWLGYLAATCTTLSFVPQAVKTIRTRDTSGISLLMYVVFTLGIGALFHTSDDARADMAAVRQWYRPWMGRNRGTGQP